MRLEGFIFKPALIPSLATLLLLPVLLSLGFWQLDRARQKETLLAAFTAQTEMPTVPVSKVDLSDSSSRYRRVTAQGRYDGEHQILLDNQIVDGRPGFHVFTPFRLESEVKAILVNRGWVALGESRQKLPDISMVDTGLVAIEGRLSQPANPGLRLDGRDSTWPRVVQYLDYEQLSAELGYGLAPTVILLDPRVSGGYRREWRPNFAGLGPERHQGYAVQWFALAAALAVIYVGVNVRRHRAQK